MTTITHIYDAQREMVSVTASGEGTPESILPMYEKARDLARMHESKRVLLNLINFSINYDAEHIINVLYKLIPVINGLQIARVVDDSNFRQDLIEQLAVSHKLNLKNFNNIEDALGWFCLTPDLRELTR